MKTCNFVSRWHLPALKPPLAVCECEKGFATQGLNKLSSTVKSIRQKVTIYTHH